MADKIKMAVSWAAACGGCDVSVLDTEEHVLALAALADIVYWPVAMDFKRAELLALPPKSIDIGLFNGAIRTSEQQQDAEVFRDKCKVLVAFGSCACFGGIPGLANVADREQIFDVAYQSTPSTENPDGLRPQTVTPCQGGELTLPAFFDTVKTLSQVVAVDVVLPGCPPPVERVVDLIGVAERYAQTGELPPAGTVIADDKALCDRCPRRDTREGGRIAEVLRPHEALADPERCFLDQGILCMGLATRGGCGTTCIKANMPCRGCFGPTAEMLDPGAEAISAIGSIAGQANENFVPAHEMKKAVRSIRDPLGTFYRFTLPSALIPRAVVDEPKSEKP
jgi:F420-non-reducing hydrogenase small subunit